MRTSASYHLSIIIPAYNKRAVLPDTLRALEHQDLENDFEVIVVDDGSTDGTLDWLQQQVEIGASARPYPLKILSQTNDGAAAARNAGAAIASGELLLFLDADIVASPQLLSEHSAGQARYNQALVIGRVLPWPAVKRGYASRIFEQSFDLGEEARELSPCFGLSQNMSISVRDFREYGALSNSQPPVEDDASGSQAVARSGFDPMFPRGQDIEFAYRLHGRGMHLHYCPQALAFHNHVMPIHDLCTKIRRDHRLLTLLLNQCPQILHDLDYLEDKLPIDWHRDAAQLVLRKTWRTALATLPARAALQLMCAGLERYRPSSSILQFLVWKLLGAYQWLGLHEGIRQHGWRSNATS